MDKVYDQRRVEEKWYKFWEEKGYFKPEVNPKGKPYTIILPPPNANAPLHFGHAMYVVEDILIRYHRMKGEQALWLPGADHAGFETQVVFEGHLAKMGKSRFDYDRDTLYQMIWDFVQKNKGDMEDQLRRLGFSLDWAKEKFSLDSDVIKVVYKTFKKLFDDNLAYRAKKLVNYCTNDGTSFSDLEVVYENRKDPLYYIKYGPIIIATTRPETLFGDMAVVVNPDDDRYKHLINTNVPLPLTSRKIPVIADKGVDKEFGSGAVKVTPAHDFADFEIGQSYKLEVRQVIELDGKMSKQTEEFAGMSINQARRKIVAKLTKQGLIAKIDKGYKHRVGLCYKCKTTIEPLPLEQWFINIKPLARVAIEAVKSDKIKIFPKNYQAVYFNWMDNIKDWNISRQIVWGIRIPAWKCLGCVQWVVTEGETPQKCSQCSSSNLEQDPDTFDTWFSSGQWPFATLQASSSEDFDKFYPTSVMETGYDILFFWVARMIMLGIYATGKVPFRTVLLHGLVKDPLGQKMSKSKGNVVNPMELVEGYGADAVRLALVFNTVLGHDQSLSHSKLSAMRNFTNKLWNIGRFIIDFAPSELDPRLRGDDNNTDKEILEELNKTITTVAKALDAYRFHEGADEIYNFIWHKFADQYIEKSKDRRTEAQPVLEYVFKTSLELLHPFMPFITEELWQKLPHKGKSIMVTQWPSLNSK